MRHFPGKDTPECQPPRPPFVDPDETRWVVLENESGDGRVDSIDCDVEAISVGFYESCFSKANFNAYSFISDCHSLFKQYEEKKPKIDIFEGEGNIQCYEEIIHRAFFDETTNG